MKKAEKITPFTPDEYFKGLEEKVYRELESESERNERLKKKYPNKRLPAEDVSVEKVKDRMYKRYCSEIEAFNKALEKADNGDAGKQYSVGCFLDTILDERHQDKDKALYYFIKAAEQNHPYGALQACLAFRKKEPEKAKQFYGIYKKYNKDPEDNKATFPEFEK